MSVSAALSAAASRIPLSEHQDEGEHGKLAGLAGSDHYRQRLSPLRYSIRAALLPIIRAETPILAQLQTACRSTVLDFWFVYSANLGGHTAFLTLLPILFWFGDSKFPLAITEVLAAGVFFSSMVKDWLCLPRPLSPPLHRLNMSGSTGLEYGFLSSHSTNAVSVAYYALALVHDSTTLVGTPRLAVQVGVWTYLVTIVFGRLYCGMHGFLDVVCGSILGYAIAWVRYAYRAHFNRLIDHPSLAVSAGLVLAVVLLILAFPQPADACPCFDDGVAFAGVVIGLNLGFALVNALSLTPAGLAPGSLTNDFTQLSIAGVALRIVLGVSLVLIWRAVAKTVLLRTLPPLYRLLSRSGLSLPRRGFYPARLYGKVPTDNVPDDFFPDVRRIPHALGDSFGKRARSRSVGPFSAADVHAQVELRSRAAAAATAKAGTSPDAKGRSRSSSLRYAQTIDDEDAHDPAKVENDTQVEEMHIVRPRRRYDVEVVTKLVVYAGVGATTIVGVPLAASLLFP